MNSNVCGLVNIGNTCFMNSALQILVNCTVMTKFFINNEFESPILNCYRDFLISYHRSKNLAPKNIKQMISQKYPDYRGFQQHDSQEFLINIIEVLEDELKEEQKTNPRKVLSYNMDKLLEIIFNINITSIVFCDETKEKSKTKIGEKMLSIPIPKKNNISVKDCLQSFSEIEKLTGLEQWKSEKLGKKVDAYKRLYLKSVPKYFLLHLKRFSFFGSSTKNNTPVDFSEEIEINNNTYLLRGIIHHMGSVNGGHYISLIKKDKWYICNDSNISEADDISEYLKQGYLYLYVKSK